jgi:hypothetical protein
MSCACVESRTARRAHDTSLNTPESCGHEDIIGRRCLETTTRSRYVLNPSINQGLHASTKQGTVQQASALFDNAR